MGGTGAAPLVPEIPDVQWDPPERRSLMKHFISIGAGVAAFAVLALGVLALGVLALALAVLALAAAGAAATLSVQPWHLGSERQAAQHSDPSEALVAKECKSLPGKQTPVVEEQTAMTVTERVGSESTESRREAVWSRDPWLGGRRWLSHEGWEVVLLHL